MDEVKCGYERMCVFSETIVSMHAWGVTDVTHRKGVRMWMRSRVFKRREGEFKETSVMYDYALDVTAVTHRKGVKCNEFTKCL